MFIYCFGFIQLWFKTANEARPADHKAWPVRGDTNKQAWKWGLPSCSLHVVFNESQHSR